MGLWQDVKFSLRLALQNWRLVSGMLVTICVAVATGATTLSVVNAVLLRPLPFFESERLFRVKAASATAEPVWVSWPAFIDWQANLRRQHLAGYTMADFSVLGGDGPESILAAIVSPSYFEVMRVGPQVGRVFQSSEYASGSERVVMLTHGFWQRRYGGDPGLIGRRIPLVGPEYMKGSAGDYMVVGVLPETFWPFWKQLEVIVPFRPSATQATVRGRPAIESVISRLADGATHQEATAELETIVSSLKAQHGSAESVAAVQVIPVRDAQFANFRDRLLLVMASAAVMFVLAIVNVATLLMAQAVARQQEFAVRLALGARQAHLIRQAMVEGFLLGGVGGAAGLILGASGTYAIRAAIPVDLLNRLPGEAAAITLDGRVVALTVAAVLLMSVAYGIVTAASIRSVRAHLALREDARGATDSPRHGRARATMLGVQLALAVALVLAVTVLSLNLSRLESIGVGIAPEGVYRVWLNLSPSRYPTTESRISYFDRVLERVQSGSGIESVGGIDLPFNEDWQRTRVAVDQQQLVAEQMPEALARVVTPGYFSTVGIRLLSGRSIEDADRRGTMPVAVVSRALATRLWRAEDPIGRSIRPHGPDPSAPWLTVVGVVDDIRQAPQEPPAAIIYRPLRQQPSPWLYLMIKTTRPMANLKTDLQQSIWLEDRDQPVEGPVPVSDAVDRRTAGLRFIVLIGTIFGGVGLVLAFAGVYGVTAHLARRSTREIGIRKALGARESDITSMFVRRAGLIAALSVPIGVATGLALVRLLQAEVEGIEPSSPWVLLAVAALFAGLVTVATFLASRRAAAMEPAIAVRIV